MNTLAWAGVMLAAFIVGVIVGSRMTARRYRHRLGGVVRVHLTPPPE